MTTYPVARGRVTPFGYRRLMLPDRRQRFEHVLVWEAHRGPVLPGMELHHVNGDKLDNRVENLQMVTRLDHKRIHSGCQLRDGVWWKRCRACQGFKPVSEFYRYSYSGVMGVCKSCCSRLAVQYKRRRRERGRTVAPAATGRNLIPERTPAIVAGVAGGAA